MVGESMAQKIRRSATSELQAIVRFQDELAQHHPNIADPKWRSFVQSEIDRRNAKTEGI